LIHLIVEEPKSVFVVVTDQRHLIYLDVNHLRLVLHQSPPCFNLSEFLPGCLSMAPKLPNTGNIRGPDICHLLDCLRAGEGTTSSCTLGVDP
jgi:hypothetical protein